MTPVEMADAMIVGLVYRAMIEAVHHARLAIYLLGGAVFLLATVWEVRAVRYRRAVGRRVAALLAQPR